MLSILIPSRNEYYLNRTIQNLLEKAEGEIEIIVILDGYWTDPVKDNCVHYIHRGVARGLRAGLNSAVALAKGKYIMKTDAHCLWDKEFDVKLIADCEPKWTIIPRRKRLDPEKWEVAELGKIDVDGSYFRAQLIE